MHNARLVLTVLLAAGAGAAGAVPPYPGHGCWVQLFGGPGYDTPTVRVEGPEFFEDPRRQPVIERELAEEGGQPFVDDVGSIIVGPRATAEVFAETEFTGPSLKLGPGDRVSDLAALAFGDRVASIRIRCSFDEGKEVLDAPPR